MKIITYLTKKKSLDFYEKALGLKEVRRKEAVALTIYQ